MDMSLVEIGELLKEKLPKLKEGRKKIVFSVMTKNKKVNDVGTVYSLIGDTSSGDKTLEDLETRFSPGDALLIFIQDKNPV